MARFARSGFSAAAPMSREIRHGYGYDPASRPYKDVEGPFAFHLRRLRRDGMCSLTQRSLAQVAHVSRSFVEDLETTTRLQNSIEALIRVALAIGQPVEALLSPERLRALREEIARRRSAFSGGDASRDKTAAAPHESELSLAVAYRAPFLITALSDGKTVLEIRACRAWGSTSDQRLAWLIEREAKTYRVREVIVEPDGKTAGYVASLSLRYRTITFKNAKRYVAGTGDGPPPPNRTFFKFLVDAHPELAKYVKVLPTGTIAASERWRTVRLVVATLSLAAAAAKVPPRRRRANRAPSPGRATPEQPPATAPTDPLEPSSSAPSLY